MNSGLVVVDRAYWLRLATQFGKRPVSEPKFSAFRKLCLDYRGFDGEFWPGESPGSLSEKFLVPPNQINPVEKYYQSVRSEFCELIYVHQMVRRSQDVPAVSGFKLGGFDLGFCDPDQGRFSCIFHEVLQGANLNLTGFAPELNRAKLFTDPNIEQRYLQARQKAKDTGTDLETGDMALYAVFFRSENEVLPDRTN